MGKNEFFNGSQLQVVNDMAHLAESLVLDDYKPAMIKVQYEIRTLANLKSNEIVQGPFAQIVRYVGQRNYSALKSTCYDYYSICLQDHAILDALQKAPHLSLPPFLLYIVMHELIHLCRFTKFQQNFFEGSMVGRQSEETRVNEETCRILPNTFPGIAEVIQFFTKCDTPRMESTSTA